MALNPYDTCPCGSGKKFKFCCEKYFGKIEQALGLYQQGQHAAGLQTMEQVTRENPGYAPVWGYYANLLYNEGQVDQAEDAIQKGFDINPNFAMGHLLRGIFRQQEGEIIGALLLFRKAAEAYDPAAHDQLAQVYEMIAQNELMLNRPVACRAALERAAHFDPSDEELRQQFEGLFGSQSRLPGPARKKYTFRPTAKPISVDVAPTGRFSDAKTAYDALTKQVPDDPAAWFNLGLVRAWLGDQPAAVDALYKSLELEWDDAKAEETGALVEVLRCGHGMENESDYIEHRIFMQLRDPNVVFAVIQEWANAGKLMSPEMDQQNGVFSCILIEELPSLLDTGTTMAKIVANFTISNGVIRIWSTDQNAVRTVATNLRDRVNLAVGEPSESAGPANFGDLLLEALAVPVRVADPAAAEGKMRDFAANFFENVWARRSLRSLNGATPLDAGGSKLLRKRLLGVVKFVEEALLGAVPRKQVGNETVPIAIYDFQRLRHKIGAELQAPGDAPTIAVPADTKAPEAKAPEAKTPEVKPAAKRDFNAMNAADLAGLPAAELSATELEDAMRAALKLEARELAVAFAKAGTAKPFDAAKPDRYPFYACLITGALSEGGPAAAIEPAEAGAKYDAEHNGGKRANDFSVRKGQLLARKGDADAAAAEFEALIERNPTEPKFLITATEAMLSAKQGAKALHFAEKGLAAARSTSNRDLEGACLEMSEAAKRQIG